MWLFLGGKSVFGWFAQIVIRVQREALRPKRCFPINAVGKTVIGFAGFLEEAYPNERPQDLGHKEPLVVAVFAVKRIGGSFQPI